MNKSFKQFLIETPIGEYRTIGNFDKSSSFRNLRDRKMITNPRAIEITKKKFSNNEYVFNLYFVNSSSANKYTEVGIVSPEWVKQRLGNEVYDAVSPKLNSDDINVIFTNNKGSENMPMTPWMMAHRIAHALGRFDNMRRQVYSYQAASDTIFLILSNILSNCYGYSDMPDNSSKRAGRKNELLLKHFFTSVCTFRSARKGKIREWFEVLHELFAQYITTGKIKFNSPPEKFGSKVAFNNGTGVYYLNSDSKDDAIDMLNELANDLQLMFDNMLSEVSNKILVM